MGVLLITHDFGVVADVADRVVVLRHGKVVEHGTVEEVLRNPREAYTRELIDAVPKARVKRRETERRPRRCSTSWACARLRVKRGWFQPPREVVAADGISLTLHEGETLAVVGEVRLRQVDPWPHDHAADGAGFRRDPARRRGPAATARRGAAPGAPGAPDHLPGPLLQPRSAPESR